MNQYSKEKLGDLMREDIENGGALQIWLRRSMLHSWTRDPMFCHALTKAICDLTWSTDSTDVSPFIFWVTYWLHLLNM